MVNNIMSKDEITKKKKKLESIRVKSTNLLLGI
jgi:hypothetical protein